MRQAGGRLRVTTHLVSVAQGFDLWSETYEGDVSEIFAVQDEIARAVTRTLRLRLPVGAAPAPAPRTRLDAYRAYLAGRALAARPTDENIPAAITNFETSIGLDSAFAPAWISLAEARAGEILRGLRPTKELAPLARGGRGARARARQHQRPRPRGARAGALHPRLEVGRRPSASSSARSSSTRTSPDPHHWYSHLLTALGRRDESLEESRRALALSPLDPELTAHLGWHYLHAGRVRAGRHRAGARGRRSTREAPTLTTCWRCSPAPAATTRRPTHTSPGCPRPRPTGPGFEPKPAGCRRSRGAPMRPSVSTRSCGRPR